MPDPDCDTLQHRLRVLEGRLQAIIPSSDRISCRTIKLVLDALAELRSLERAVAERPELSGARISHGETP